MGLKIQCGPCRASGRRRHEVVGRVVLQNSELRSSRRACQTAIALVLALGCVGSAGAQTVRTFAVVGDYGSGGKGADDVGQEEPAEGVFADELAEFRIDPSSCRSAISSMVRFRYRPAAMDIPLKQFRWRPPMPRVATETRSGNSTTNLSCRM